MTILPPDDPAALAPGGRLGCGPPAAIAPRPSPGATATGEIRPSVGVRPTTSLSLRCVVLQGALGLLLLLLADAVLFRSGWYFQWVAPASSAGTMSVAIDDIAHVAAGRDAVLAIGDSRVGEGFSMRTAQQAMQQAGLPYRFYNDAVAGTTPRVWYYLLRQVTQPEQRIAAVAMMVTSYHDNEPENLAARSGDIAFVHPLLRLRDISDFPWTFPTAATRTEAIESILLPGLFYAADLRDFLTDPAGRIDAAIGWHRHGFAWISDYGGRAPSLQGLQFDPPTGRLTIPAGLPALQTSLLPDYAATLLRFRGRPPDNAAAAAYRRLWLGRIATWCRRANIRLFVFRIPRGPLDDRLPSDDTPTGVLAELAQAGLVELLPARLFVPLERPAYFFDRLHLNAAGRGLFSAMLARAIAQRLETRTNPRPNEIASSLRGPQ